MAKVNWRFVFKIMKAHGWREIDLCRLIGISQPHWCDIKQGRRRPSLAFVDCLCHVLRCTYDSVLIHPTVSRIPSAREALALKESDDGRPWLKDMERLQYGPSDHYGQYEVEKKLADELPKDLFPNA